MATDKSNEVLKLALEALENINSADNDRDFLGPEECCDLDNAITALREALAEQALDKMAENARQVGLDYEPEQHMNIIKQPMLPDTIHFHHTMNNGDTEVMRITRTGVWVNPDMSIDDTAKAVLAALDSQIKVLVQAERQAELNACCDLLEGMHVATDGNHNYYLHAANELRKLRGKK